MTHYLMQFFEYSHLPPHLQIISERFRALAVWIIRELPDNAEKTTALRKLLEARDSAVRAKIYKQEG